MTERLDPRLIVLDPADNVAVVRCRIDAGERYWLGDAAWVAAAPLPLGHKVALRAISAGEKIRKYGAPIGSAICGISAGAHVHVHNVRSDYTPTHHLLEQQSGQERET